MRHRSPLAAAPLIALIALLAAPAAAETGLQVKWVSGAFDAATRVVTLRAELHNLDAIDRPVKPFDARFTRQGQRLPAAEIDVQRLRVVTSSTGRTATGLAVLQLMPGERATVDFPTMPLPAAHGALKGGAVGVLEFTSPRVPRLTVRGPVEAATDAPSAPQPAAAAAAPAAATSAHAPERWPAAGFQRGVVYSSWDGTYPHTEKWKADLDHFRDLGVNWIEILTFAEQPAVNGPAIRPMPAARWPRAFVAEARRRGFKILVKPHVWSRQFYDGSNRWRGSIAMPDAATWDQWFANYGDFIEREARLAAEAGAEMFSIGLEYVEATKGHTDAWRRIIRRVRAVYPGLLTYAADGNHEARHVGFWGELDVIGIDAYFDVGDATLPGGADLRLGWLPYVAWMKALAEQHGKPIVFTEAGYPSVVGATRKPWKWPDGSEQIDTALQAQAYDALMRVCTAGDWCRGVYWWKYYEKDERGTSHAHDYDPRGKLAEAVLRRWYQTPAP